MYYNEHPEPKLLLWLSVLVPILVDVVSLESRHSVSSFGPECLNYGRRSLLEQKQGCRCMADSVDEVMREEEVAKLDDDIVVVSEIIFKNFLMSS